MTIEKEIVGVLGGGDAFSLLNVLGYKSDRISDEEILDRFSRDTRSVRNLKKHVKSIKIVFQVTNNEIAENFEIGGSFFDESDAKSFIFLAATLFPNTKKIKNHAHYSRTQYSEFAREISRNFRMPVVIVFIIEAPKLWTLAFVDRARHKTNHALQTLGKAYFIKEINGKNPHRAHVRLLKNLSLYDFFAQKNLEGKNFLNLHKNWIRVLDTEKLNDNFYDDLVEWVEKVKQEGTFPITEHIDGDEGKQFQVIRLITRLLFVWFLKEKELIPGELFLKDQIDGLVCNFLKGSNDSYYRVILQNLFFATLNNKIQNRGFCDESQPASLLDYKYKKEIKNTQKLLNIFNQIPFVNGGLFECQDKADSVDKNDHSDCFSDDDIISGSICLPDRLFFDENDGIFAKLRRYIFTVEENTPIDQEVALDPELLGKVFENLLAVTNLDKEEAERRKTGSYYTPREIVDHMVENSLVSVIFSRLKFMQTPLKVTEIQLQSLVTEDYAIDEPEKVVSQSEARSIIEVIASLKIIDPAVGSGAFAMAVLHKLSLILKRLDPNNKIWYDLQKTITQKETSGGLNEETTTDLGQQLHRRGESLRSHFNHEFGRKLYLIQNNIHGVDIQNMAIQICKLRFFITLIVEQERNENPEENYGIMPLPNLETRFVIADTLLPLISKSEESKIRPENILITEAKLILNRKKHFNARSADEKNECRALDSNLREDLIEQLKESKWLKSETADVAKKILNWNPFDQNHPVDWFNSEYMFGIIDGFDIVVGNPPYRQLQKDDGYLADKYSDCNFSTFVRTGDIYCLFFEQGINLLKEGGYICFITSNKWIRINYGEKLRELFCKKNPKKLLDFYGKKIFPNVSVDTSIFLLENVNFKNQLHSAKFEKDANHDINIKQYEHENMSHTRAISKFPWVLVNRAEREIVDKIEKCGTRLKCWNLKIRRGILTGYNKAFIINESLYHDLIESSPKNLEIIMPCIMGKHLTKYLVTDSKCFLINSHNGYTNNYGDKIEPINISEYDEIKRHLDKSFVKLANRDDKGDTPYNLRKCAYVSEFEKEKIVWSDISASGNFSYDKNGFLCEATTFFMTGKGIKYLCAVLNSNLIHWFFKSISPNLGENALRWKKTYVLEIPIPKFGKNETIQIQLQELLDQIISRVENGQDILEYENQLNDLVYDLYELNPKEIQIVKNNLT